jgi:hypothetical protein
MTGLTDDFQWWYPDARELTAQRAMPRQPLHQSGKSSLTYRFYRAKKTGIHSLKGGAWCGIHHGQFTNQVLKDRSISVV